jgi:hypothetical protein
MATLRETVNVADQLTELSQQLRAELTDGDVDFDKMIQIADEISEQADELASAFERVNEALGGPLDQVGNGHTARSGSARQSRSSSESSSGSTKRSSSGSTKRSRSGSRSRSSTRRRSTSSAGRSVS